MKQDEELLRELKALCFAFDPEIYHIKADDLLCEVLLSLGFSESVKFFKDSDKWYS
jgi:hypothetical protein